MFKTRLRSSIVLVILTIAVLYFGGWVTVLALLLLSLKGVQELLRVYKLDKSSFAILAYTFTVILYIIIYLEKKSVYYATYNNIFVIYIGMLCI